jgi:battenin
MILLVENLWKQYYSKFVFICYWCLGLGNNFAYVIMLSAAHDILSEMNAEKNNVIRNETIFVEQKNQTYNKYDCNDLSTGAVLLADILPGIFVKSIAPFFVHKLKYWQRFIFVVLSNSISFSLVALSPSSMQWLIFIGIMCASLCASFGEITFLSLSTQYPRKIALPAWSSGTGAAGLIGSLGYAGLTSFGLSPRVTILIMLFIPVLMIISFILLPTIAFTQTYFPHLDDENEKKSEVFMIKNRVLPIEDENPKLNGSNSDQSKHMSLRDKAKSIKLVLKFMIPLFIVYFSQYFINQGLFELLYFEDAFLTEHKLQYR